MDTKKTQSQSNSVEKNSETLISKGEVHLILPEPLPNKISKSKNWCQRQSCAVFSTQTGMSVCPKINLFISEILAENPTVDVAWERDYLFKVTISKY